MDKAITLLLSDELVVIPTETVYGLAANALSENAVKKIFALKNRPATNPLICHVASVDAMKRFIHSDKRAVLMPLLRKLNCFWPGPLTVVVPKDQIVPDITTAQEDSVALRIPNHPDTLALLAKLPFPLAAPSANRSNYISPTTAAHVKNELKDECPYIIDGGACSIGIESTVLSLLDPNHPQILRPGAITAEQLTTALNIKVTSTAGKDSKHSPGQLDLHYSPKTKLSFLSQFDFSATHFSRIGLIAFNADTAKDEDFAAIEILSENNNHRDISVRLYDAMRKLDAFELDIILIDECEETGIGTAIMDRVKRAITK